MKNFFYFSISFIIAIFFILLGIVGLLLPWSSEIRTNIVQFFLEDFLYITLFSLGLVIAGIAIIINVLFSARKHYYEIKSGSNSFAIDEALFQDYLNTYWKQLFPKIEIPNRVVLKKNKIHVAADLPYVPLDQQKDLLKRIEKDLSDIFNRIFGYRNEYIISISFQEEPKSTAL